MKPRINALALRCWFSAPQPIHVRLVLRQHKCNGKRGDRCSWQFENNEMEEREREGGRFWKERRCSRPTETPKRDANGENAHQRLHACRNQPLHVRYPTVAALAGLGWQTISPMKSGMRRLEDLTCICDRLAARDQSSATYSPERQDSQRSLYR